MRKKITVIGNHFAFDEINGYTVALGLYEVLAEKYDIDIIVPRELDIYPNKVRPFGRNITLRSVAADDTFLAGTNLYERFYNLAKNPALRKQVKGAGDGANIIICDGFFHLSLARELFPEKMIALRSLHVEYDQLLWRNLNTSDTFSRENLDSAFQFEKEAYEKADCVFALTDYDRDRLCELYGIPKEKIKMIPLCFPDAYLSHNYLPKKRGSRKALYMSACSIENPEFFVSMMEKIPQVEFHIVGKAGFELQGYGPNVIVHGVVSEDELRRIEADCDFALNLTHMESGTNSKMMDYFSSGIPVVCNDLGARGFQARAGEHYFRANFDTMEQDIRDFLALSGEERYQMAVNAFRHLCTVFDYRNYTQYIDALIAGDRPEDVASAYYIFGAGLYGRTALFEMKKRGKSCIGFIDNDSKRWGELYYGVKIISPEEAFRALKADEDIRLMIAVSTQYLGDIVRQAVPEIGTKRISVYGMDEIDLNKAMRVL